jgi:hypothetical protein
MDTPPRRSAEQILAEREAAARAKADAESRYRPGLAVFALVSTLLMSAAALGLAGLGYGWGAPLVPSLFATLIVPVLALIERRSSFRFLGCFFLAVALLTDWWIIHATQTDEPTYFTKMWSYSSVTVCFWIAIWGGWQLWLIWALVRPLVPLSPVASDSRSGTPAA